MTLKETCPGSYCVPEEVMKPEGNSPSTWRVVCPECGRTYKAYYDRFFSQVMVRKHVTVKNPTPKSL